MRPSYPSSSSKGETLATTEEVNSWSTGPPSRSTSSVRRGPPEKRASTSSAPSGSALSTTSASLSNLAVFVAPRFETLKKQRILRTPCSIQLSYYIVEYLGYKAALAAHLHLRSAPETPGTVLILAQVCTL